jgi:protein KRI1
MQIEVSKLAKLFADELDKDFDPAEYDKKMAQLFSDEYYGMGEDELEPTAPVAAAKPKQQKKGASKDTTQTVKEEVKSSEKEKGEGDDGDDDEDDAAGVPMWVFGDGPRPRWAGPSALELASGIDELADILPSNANRSATAAADGDDDYDAHQHAGGEGSEDEASARNKGASKRKHKNDRKRSKSAVARAQEYLKSGDVMADDPDEVLKLGFEDVIAGGLKTRFNYISVPANDYGLSAEEIVLMEEKQLNQYLSLKKLAPYRDVDWELPKQQKRVLKHLRRELKETLRPLGLVADDEEDGAEESKAEAKVSTTAPAPTDTDVGKTSHKREHKKKQAAVEEATAADVDTRVGESEAEDHDEDQDVTAGDDGAGAPAASGKKRRRRHHKKSASQVAASDKNTATSADKSCVPSAPATTASTSKTEASTQPTAVSTKPKQQSNGGHGKSGEHKSNKKVKVAAGAFGKKDTLVAVGNGLQLKQSRLAAYGLD